MKMCLDVQADRKREKESVCVCVRERESVRQTEAMIFTDA
jgi:hypothetical protein